jgi:arabinoxylan arabinofuranohydrolase
MLRAKGEGTVEIRLGRKGATPAITVNVSSSDMSDYTVDVDPSRINGQKSFYIVVSSGTDVYLDAWQFTEVGAAGIHEIEGNNATKTALYDLSGRRISDAHQHSGVIIEQYTDEKGVKHSRKVFSRSEE